MGLADALGRFDAAAEERRTAEAERSVAVAAQRELVQRRVDALGAETVALCEQLGLPRAAKCSGKRVPDPNAPGRGPMRVDFTFEEYWWDLGAILIDPRGAFYMKPDFRVIGDPPGGWQWGRPSDERGSFDAGAREIVQRYGATRLITGAVRLEVTGDNANLGGEWDPGLTLYIDAAGAVRRTRDHTNFEDELAVAIRKAASVQ